MMAYLGESTALLVIDVQKGMEEYEASGHQRNNPQAADRIAELISHFRIVRAPIYHIRHASLEKNSLFRPKCSGYAVMEQARERPGEPVIVKHVSSAFIGTDLEKQLRRAGITTLVIAGATINHCVEATARMAADLGFSVKLVRDATWAFDLEGPDGEHHSAEDIHAMTLANLHGAFATIVRTADIIQKFQPIRRQKNA